MWPRLIIVYIVFSGSCQLINSQDLIFSSEESDSAEDSLMVIGLRENTTDGFKTITEYSAVNCANDDFKTKSELNMYTNNVDLKEALQKHENRKLGCGISKEKEESSEWDDYKTKPLVTLVTEGAVKQPPAEDKPEPYMPPPPKPPEVIPGPVEPPMTCLAVPPVQSVGPQFEEEEKPSLSEHKEILEEIKDIQKMAEDSQLSVSSESLEKLESDESSLKSSENGGIKIGSGLVADLSEPQKIEMSFAAQKMNTTDHHQLVIETEDPLMSMTLNVNKAVSIETLDKKFDEKENQSDNGSTPIQSRFSNHYSDEPTYEESYEHPDTNWRLDESSLNNQKINDDKINSFIAPRFSDYESSEIYEDLDYLNSEIHQPWMDQEINAQIEAPPLKESFEPTRPLEQYLPHSKQSHNLHTPDDYYDYYHYYYEYKEDPGILPRFENYEDIYDHLGDHYYENDYSNHAKEHHPKITDSKKESKTHELPENHKNIPQKPEAPNKKAPTEDLTDLLTKTVHQKFAEKSAGKPIPIEEEKKSKPTVPMEEEKISQPPIQELKPPEDITQQREVPKKNETKEHINKGRPEPPKKQGPKKKFGEVKFQLSTPLNV